MAIHWGPLVSRQQVGIEIVVTGDTNTVRNLRTRIVQRTNFASFNFDGQAWWNRIGWGGDGTHRGRLSGSNVFIHASMYSSHTRNFGAARNYNLSASSVTFSPGQTAASYVHGQAHIPARPAQSPNTPSTPTISAITQTLATGTTNNPANNGAAINRFNWHWFPQPSGNSWPASGIPWTYSSGNSQRLGNAGNVNAGTAHGHRPLIRNTRYICRVRAGNSVGWSGWSGTAAFTTSPGVPNTVTGLSRGATQPRQAAFTWGTPGNNGAALNGRQIQRATNSGFTAGVSTSETGWNTSHTITGLAPATAHWVRVRARNSVGWGPWSAVHSFTTPADVPNQVTGLTRGATAWNQAAFTWATPATNGNALNGRQVQRATNSGFTTGLVTHETGWNTSITIPNLDPNTQYWVRVRARNGVGWGAWSGVHSFTTPARTPDAPGAFTAHDIGPDSTRLTWTAPFNGGAAITGYRIEWSLNNWGNVHGVNVGNVLIHTLTGLQPGTAYQVRVRAVNSVGNGAWANTAITTLPGVYARVEGQWRPARTWVRVNGAWHPARVWKRVNGSWSL